MKKIIVYLASVAVVAGTLVFTRTGAGQETAAPASAPASNAPHKVGLIDMAHVFKNYTKFTALSEALKAEVEASDAEAKAMVTEMQQIQSQLQSGQIAEGSPDFVEKERLLVQKKAELESFRAEKQREFLRKEAEIYKTVYLEVQSAVKQYADHFNYTLIMRFNRTKVEDAENPQEIIQSMNRPVVFYHGQDDLTDPVLNWLNQLYTRNAGRPAPAGGPARQ